MHQLQDVLTFWLDKTIHTILGGVTRHDAEGLVGKQHDRETRNDGKTFPCFTLTTDLLFCKMEHATWRKLLSLEVWEYMYTVQYASSTTKNSLVRDFCLFFFLVVSSVTSFSFSLRLYLSLFAKRHSFDSQRQALD